MKGLIPPLIAILIGIGYYYFQPSGVIESSGETRTEDNPLAKNNLENKESQDKPVSVIARPEETPREDKPLAKKSFETMESEDKEIYGGPFPRRYSFE